MTPRQPATAGELRRSALVVAPLTAAALIAQQVASNAVRDALFLTWFEVTSLPYFMGAAAVLAIPAAESSGRLLARFGPARVVPFILGVSSVLFLVEWRLLGAHPRLASGLVYFHASVLGAIGISAFWSLLNERFDPHSAKALMARVAAAATFGGMAGGVGAERVAALMSQGALFTLLGLSAGASVVGAAVIGRGMPARRGPPAVREKHRSGWAEIWRVPLLRELALVVALAAALAALMDYLLKAEVVAWLGKGEPLVRFFGLFDAATGLAAFLLQALLGRPDSCPGRARRLGGQPPSARRRGRCAGLRSAGALACHSSSRTRCDAPRFNLPDRLRALLHAAARGHQASGQVGGGRERGLYRQGRRRGADRAAHAPRPCRAHSLR